MGPLQSMIRAAILILLVVTGLWRPLAAHAACPLNLPGDWEQDVEHYLARESAGDDAKRRELEEHITSHMMSMTLLENGSGTFKDHGLPPQKIPTREYDITYQITELEDGSCLITFGAEGFVGSMQHTTSEIRARDRGFCMRASTDFEQWDCYIPAGEQ